MKRMSKRAEVDLQMRRRLSDLIGDCPLSTLHGISVFGRKLKFYTLHTSGTISPDVGPSESSAHRYNNAPMDQWSLDILEPEGEIQVRRITDGLIKAFA